ncbi:MULTISPECIES: hypothetical protein [Natrialbaceae]|uniref:hypothetical protein n=1 Tax=Natrialbaceae TaxID=1644061 RepID=UPI00207CF676|nr:hypothetical protein [Natronococcus sp. CG52]
MEGQWTLDIGLQLPVVAYRLQHPEQHVAAFEECDDDRTQIDEREQGGETDLEKRVRISE